MRRFAHTLLGDDIGIESRVVPAEDAGVIADETETNLTALRRTIYLTVMNSLEHNECAHKLMKMQLKPGQETELCHMILDCCTQQRTYEKFFGLLAQVTTTTCTAIGGSLNYSPFIQ